MFTAGYNMPGCLPENDPETFDSFEDAVAYLVDTVDTFWDQDSHGFRGGNGNANDIWLDIHTALHNIGNAGVFSDYAGGYHFWIKPTDS